MKEKEMINFSSSSRKQQQKQQQEKCHNLISRVLTLRQNRVNLSIELVAESTRHTSSTSKTTTTTTTTITTTSSSSSQKKVTFVQFNENHSIQESLLHNFKNKKIIVKDDEDEKRMHSNPIYGTGTNAIGDMDLECVSSHTLEVYIMQRFAELRQYALLQLALDDPPVQLSMLESVYMLKMGALRYETDLELAKFDRHVTDGGGGGLKESKGYQKLKVLSFFYERKDLINFLIILDF